ncbi:MAG: hypothetical protein AB1428_09685 [Bacteroidota bacterium]
MKTRKFSLCVLSVALMSIAVVPQKASSEWWEWEMRVTSGGQPVEKYVFLYYYDDLSAPFRWGVTSSDGLPNFMCNIDLSDPQGDDPDATWPAIPHGTYYIRIDNKYARIDIPPAHHDADFGFVFNGTEFVRPPYQDNRGINLHETLTWPEQTITRTISQTLQDGVTYFDAPKRYTTGGESGGFVSLIPNPSGIAVPFRQGQDQVLLGEQGLFLDQKFHDWSGLPDVTNHHRFAMGGGTPNLVSHLRQVAEDIQVSTQLLDVPGVSGGTIELKDPWLRDTLDSQFFEDPYGYRNLGMNAPFKSEASGFTYGTSTKYKGVFLGQGEPNWTPPYYSVGAPVTQSISGIESYFLNWVETGGGLVRKCVRYPDRCRLYPERRDGDSDL